LQQYLVARYFDTQTELVHVLICSSRLNHNSNRWTKTSNQKQRSRISMTTVGFKICTHYLSVTVIFIQPKIIQNLHVKKPGTSSCTIDCHVLV